MARILNNKTGADANITYGTVTQLVPAGSQFDLSSTFQSWQLASSDSLLALLGQGTNSFQLNDGINDLTTTQAIDLIRGYTDYALLSDIRDSLQTISTTLQTIAANMPKS